MVKSKRMSKTSIAVIVLALLLVLSMVFGLTGAWFTSKDSSDVAVNSLSFGRVGVVDIEAVGVKHYRSGSNEELSGQPVLPGDKVTAGGLTFTYDYIASGDHNGTGTEASVYYVIFDGAKYYKIDQTELVLVELGENEAAPEINEGTSLTIPGQNLKIKLGSGNTDWYILDGVVSGAASGEGLGTYSNPKHSFEISSMNGADPQGTALNTRDMMVGIVEYQQAAFTYKVAVIQKTNVGNANASAAALTELKSIITTASNWA